MITSRDKILGQIQESLRRGELSAVEKAKLAQHMAHHQRSVLPKRAALPHSDLVNLFIEQAQSAIATVYQLKSLSDVSSIILNYLKMKSDARTLEVQEYTGVPVIQSPYDNKTNWEDQKYSICVGKDAIFHSIKWHNEFIIKNELPTYSDLVSVTSSFCAVAETGTLVLLSSPESPTTLNFLPETHFVLLSIQNIVPYYEDAWDLIRAKNSILPRNVNFITGPSRTADIEQTVQIGMHGPKELIILLYGENGR
jgi:L-lactate dehydrogenase complex protein LldG